MTCQKGARARTGRMCAGPYVRWQENDEILIRMTR